MIAPFLIEYSVSRACDFSEVIPCPYFTKCPPNNCPDGTTSNKSRVVIALTPVVSRSISEPKMTASSDWSWTPNNINMFTTLIDSATTYSYEALDRGMILDTSNPHFELIYCPRN